MDFIISKCASLRQPRTLSAHHLTGESKRKKKIECTMSSKFTFAIIRSSFFSSAFTWKFPTEQNNFVSNSSNCINQFIFSLSSLESVLLFSYCFHRTIASACTPTHTYIFILLLFLLLGDDGDNDGKLYWKI